MTDALKFLATGNTAYNDADIPNESTPSEPPAIEVVAPVLQPAPKCTRDGGQGPWLVESLLREQQSLTAVERFAQFHDQNQHSVNARYRELLPASSPREGQQYGFEVDLDRCSGCKACVTACHSLNGLDQGETWRDVGLLVGGTRTQPIMQHVTTACHHCLSPACMSACPVDAYEKDPQTGIVKHLDDQCFGCQYCTFACPYDVPKYHKRKGIVRKCDMCSDRLAVGEAPACVQACPHEAIRIGIVDKLHVIEEAEADHFLPAAPDPQMTLPTTQFKTSRVFPRNTLPADYHSVNPQHPHWPLIIMLVLTQLSVGAFTVGQCLERFVIPNSLVGFRKLHATTSLGFGLLALAASTLHLGRPQYAYRAFIGLRHSWLSREILAFSVFAGAAVVFAILSWMFPTHWLSPFMGDTVALSGWAGVFCSMMIYVATGRDFWRFQTTAARFILSSLILGVAATWLSVLLTAMLTKIESVSLISTPTSVTLIRSLALATSAKLLFEVSLFRHLMSRRQTALKRSAMLLRGPLSGSTFARLACGLLGGIVMPMFLWNDLEETATSGPFLVIAVTMLFVACLAGELLARYQFFAACAAPRMPGSLRSPA